jgi:hypothetical protein
VKFGWDNCLCILAVCFCICTCTCTLSLTSNTETYYQKKEGPNSQLAFSFFKLIIGDVVINIFIVVLYICS